MAESLSQQMSTLENENKKLSAVAKQTQVDIQMSRQVIEQLQVQMGDQERQIQKFKASEASSRDTIEKLSLQLGMLMQS